jgi:hypothetical protein
MTIGANLNGGSVTIGSTTGTTNISGSTINIGTHTTQTGNIAIGTNNAVLSGTNQIFIGANNKTTNISGSIVNIADTGLSATGRVNIATGTNVTGSEVTIGTTTLTNLFLRGNEVKINEAGGGTVFIGNPTTGTTDINSNRTNIGTTGLSATGYVSIATGANATGSEVAIGVPSLGTLFLRANEVKINHQQLKNTYIGSDAGGVTTLLGNLEVGSNGAGTINLWRPITPNYSYPIGAGKIGEIISGPKPAALTQFTGGVQISRLTLTKTGVFMLHGNILIGTNPSQITNITWISINIYNEAISVNVCVEERLNQVPPAVGYNFMMNLTGFVYHQGTADYIFALNMNYSGGQPNFADYSFKFNAVRIA